MTNLSGFYAFKMKRNNYLKMVDSIEEVKWNDLFCLGIYSFFNSYLS